jgi:hypothetical protein
VLKPPNTIISVPVHTAVCQYRGSSSWNVGSQLSSRQSSLGATAGKVYRYGEELSSRSNCARI